MIQKESENEPSLKFYINRFIGHHQTSMIIGCALLEGSAILGVVVYLLKNSVGDLVVAGAMILLMLTKIPTERQLQSSLANLVTRQKMKGEL